MNIGHGMDFNIEAEFPVVSIFSSLLPLSDDQMRKRLGSIEALSINEFI